MESVSQGGTEVTGGWVGFGQELGLVDCRVRSDWGVSVGIPACRGLPLHLGQ